MMKTKRMKRESKYKLQFQIILTKKKVKMKLHQISNLNFFYKMSLLGLNCVS